MSEPGDETDGEERGEEVGTGGSKRRGHLALVGAAAFEGSVFVLALGLARWGRIDLIGGLRPSWEAVGWGLAATVPMYLGYRALKRSRRASLVELRELVEGMVSGIFGGTTRLGLGLIAAAAGLGEESLFRGVMQPWLSGMWGVMPAVVATSIVFGLLHALTPIYGILAAVIGLYLGWLAEATGGLAAPVIAHGLYDYLVLQDIQRGLREGERD